MKRRRLNTYPYKYTSPESEEYYIVHGRTPHQYERDIRLWRYNRIQQFNNNFAFGVSLTFKVCLIALVIGYLYVLWNRGFNFEAFAYGVTAQDFSPFDYQGFIDKVNDSFDHLPGWMGGVKGLSQIFVSIGYSIGWFFNLLIYIWPVS